ncbi:NAD(P)H-hydrate dehydratase [Streptomyces sp. NPDC049954]|uniref:NAD(P)H-hydrate dehydratase n=1 Tax=Streptomyces sp. NPDC049954 TaxID=3155779 RepID=UPI00341FED82
MRTAHSVDTVRAAERRLMAQLPEGALMRRAAAGLAAACAELLGRVYGSRVTVLAGSGDNGGDALYAAARLARRGAGVTAVLLSPDRAHPAALAALRGAGGRVVEAAESEGVAGVTDSEAAGAVRRADLVLDGIVGIGGKGGLRPVAAALARTADESPGTTVAVDLPSGVDADTGEVAEEAVRADATVTFGTYKPGLLIDPGHAYAGALRLVPIGLDLLDPQGPPDPRYHAAPPGLEALQYADVAALLPLPAAESDKYRRGVVGIAAGSVRYPGAPVLAVAGALRAGAGAVRYAGPAAEAVTARFPEALVSSGLPSEAGRVQAWVVGPGLGDGEDAEAALRDVLTARVPLLMDADALGLADPEQIRSRTAPTVLTPHAGEAARLLGADRADVERQRLASVRELASRFRATVLLKGSTTLVAAPDAARAVRVNATGTSWLATAGAGDVLSGLIGSLLATGLDPLDAASAGAYLHGLAGRHAADGAPLAAHDIAAALPAAWRDVRER